MEESHSTDDYVFIVAESAWMNFLFSVIFFIIFIASLVTLSSAAHQSSRAFWTVGLMTLFPAITFLIKGTRKKPIIEINKTGILHQGVLITSWGNFIRADIIVQEPVGDNNINEDWRLAIEYFVPAEGKNYIIKLKMTDTQDKSEVQIIEAINYFLAAVSANAAQAPIS